ncbi:MAG: ABC transporter permease subunit [Clostridia bacterium]|nr:ABC transporter permease subunit [Clostridia bacterium]
MKKLSKITNYILPLITVGCLLLLWTVASVKAGSEYILPSVGKTFSALGEILSTSKFYIAFFHTFLRSLVAFLISFILASIMAFLSNRYKSALRVIDTLVSIIRALPTIAIVLVLLFWTSVQVAPVIVTMLVVLPTTYTHLKSALDSVEKPALEAGMVDGADKLNLFFRVELPQMAPAVYSAIGAGLSLNFKLMVAAEVLSATIKSLGNTLNIYNYNGQIAEMLAVVITAVVFGIIVEFIFNKISQKTGEWR